MMSEKNILSDDTKKAPADYQGRRSGERLIERPWLQLMYCALVSGREVGRVFRNGESHQDRSPKESSEGSGVDKVRLR